MQVRAHRPSPNALRRADGGGSLTGRMCRADGLGGQAYSPARARCVPAVCPAPTLEAGQAVLGTARHSTTVTLRLLQHRRVTALQRVAVFDHVRHLARRGVRGWGRARGKHLLHRLRGAVATSHTPHGLTHSCSATRPPPSRYCSIPLPGLQIRRVRCCTVCATSRLLLSLSTAWCATW